MNFIAEQLGVSKGVVQLTKAGFNIAMIGAGTYHAGKFFGNEPGYLSSAKKNGVLNIGAGLNPTNGAYNISHPNYPRAPGVYAGDATNLAGIKTGSQKLVILENPY